MFNHVKTALLLAALTILLVLIGRALGGMQGMVIAFAVALVMNVVSYWYSDKIVLGMYRAQPLTPADSPDLYRMVERLCERANLPLPKLYVLPDSHPNAFATGRDPNHAAVAVTEGLVRILDHNEVEGVIAHELAHIKNRDTLVTTVAATIAGAITMIANFAQYAAIFGFGRSSDDDDGGSNPLVMLVMIFVAPIAAMVLQLAVSRSREYLADRTGAEICGRPMALASALKKLEAMAQQHPMPAAPATAPLFIVNPLRFGGLQSLFSTHPSTADRVERLKRYAQEIGAAPAYAWR